ncbi:MAG TPA: hypothetical protein VJS86_18565 [Arthrobacter sp.]|nr:hypothetical protein [Arthrobacter sp.]
MSMTDRRSSPARAEELVSFEELRFFDCRVERAGPGEDGTIWVNLTDTGEEFSQVWFIALPGSEPKS